MKFYVLEKFYNYDFDDVKLMNPEDIQKESRNFENVKHLFKIEKLIKKEYLQMNKTTNYGFAAKTEIIDGKEVIQRDSFGNVKVKQILFEVQPLKDEKYENFLTIGSNHSIFKEADRYQQENWYCVRDIEIQVLTLDINTIEEFKLLYETFYKLEFEREYDISYILRMREYKNWSQESKELIVDAIIF